MSPLVKTTRRNFLRGLSALLLPPLAVACGAPQAPSGAIPTLTVGPLPPRPTATGHATVAPLTPSPTVAISPTPAIPTDAQGFADPAFRQLWEATDRAIAEGQASRSWLWGPKPFAVKQEPFDGAPSGVRLVQYFDKSRMEVNDPHADRADQWFVTNGLLTSEMIAGRVQTGPTTFETLEPAEVPIAGDLESPDQQTPRYSDFTNVASIANSNRAPQRLGSPVTARFNRGGATEVENKPPATVKIAAYDDTLGHNMADVFVDYLRGVGLNWVFVTGYPISEPYWVVARGGGESQVVLAQLFERRALTYNPRNKEGWRVEFANIGLHYYRWRYHNR
jgi:hypothetical protein